MKALMRLFVGLAVVLSMAGAAHAQACPAVRYAEEDKLAVLAILFDAAAHMERMNELALQSATNKYSATQRLALQNEFMAHVKYITQLGAQSAPQVHPTTARFLTDLLAHERLRIMSLSVWGPTQEEAVKRSVKTSQKILRANSVMWYCL